MFPQMVIINHSVVCRVPYTSTDISIVVVNHLRELSFVVVSSIRTGRAAKNKQTIVIFCEENINKIENICVTVKSNNGVLYWSILELSCCSLSAPMLIVFVT